MLKAASKTITSAACKIAVKLRFPDLGKTHLEFLHEIRALDSGSYVTDAARLRNAASEYSTLFHANQKALDSTHLSSKPLLWIWHVHKLNPVRYAQDLLSQQDATLSVDSLVQAALRQTKFLEQLPVLTAFFLNPTAPALPARVWAYAAQQYVRFLDLASTARHDGFALIPTLPMDLLWHAHMDDHHAYVEHTTSICGYVLPHDDTLTPEQLHANTIRTEMAWRSRYGEPYPCRKSPATNPSQTAAASQANVQPQPGTSCGASCGGYLSTRHSLLSADQGGCGSVGGTKLSSTSTSVKPEMELTDASSVGGDDGGASSCGGSSCGGGGCGGGCGGG